MTPCKNVEIKANEQTYIVHRITALWDEVMVPKFSVLQNELSRDGSNEHLHHNRGILIEI